MLPSQQFKNEAERIHAWLNRSDVERRFTNKVKDGGVLELSIMDVIGESFWFEGITAKNVKRALDAAPNVSLIKVLINSPGGYTSDGHAIMSLLKRHSARVEVEVLGEMASAATTVSMAADHIAMHEGSYSMIHQAAGGAFGFASDIRQAFEALEMLNETIIDVYTARCGRTRDEVSEAVMRTTWFSAKEAVEWGLADEVIPAKARPVPEPEPAPTNIKPDPESDPAPQYKRNHRNLVDGGRRLIDPPKTSGSELGHGRSVASLVR